MTVTVAIGDLHIPYEEPDAVKCALNIIKSLEPDNVVLIGDMIDFYPISRYMKDPYRVNTLQDEIDKTNKFLGQARDAAPHSKIVYLEGNHEDRFSRFLMTKAPELFCLRVMRAQEMLRVSDYDIEYITSNFKIGETTYTHGHVVRKHSAYTARAMSEEYGTVLFGHTHRLGTHHRRDGRGSVTAVENGCLCSLNPEYIKGVVNWQHGFTVVTDMDGTVSYEQVQFSNGKAIFRGKKWK